MNCGGVRRRLSAFLDADLAPGEGRQIAAHLEACAECRRRWRSLQQAVACLSEMPRLAPAEGIAVRVRDRIELESRGPGLSLLFRPAWAARPLMLPSLLPAALVLVTVLSAALALDRDPRAIVARTGEHRLPASGTEANPLFPSAEVTTPRVRAREPFPEGLLAGMGEGTFFLETIVARDGSVSAVTLLEGDSQHAAPLLDLLRHERFEPGRYRGRPVAVSVYRLISRMEVRPPVT